MNVVEYAAPVDRLAKKLAPSPKQYSLLERLVTHPDAFALTTAMPVQRAICRCLDGVPLGELAGDPDVQWAFGGKEAIARLPVGVLPAEVILCAATRGAKTLISSALAFKACLTVDLSGTRPKEVVRYSIAATKMDNAQAAIEHLQGTIPEAPLLRRFFVRSTKSGVVIRHPTGRHIEIRVIVAGRGGGGVVSRYSAGLTCDEAARMQGQGQIVNLPDLLRAVHGRLLPGAQVYLPGAPWAPVGPIFDAVQDDWGKPTASRVVIRAKGPMMHPAWWNPERIARTLKLKDGELIVQTDCWAEFGSPESFFFTSDMIRRATPEGRPLRVPYDPMWEYAAFMDPATRGNAWTVVIVGKLAGDSESEARYCVAFAKEWRGTKSDPVKAKSVFAELAPILEQYQLNSVSSDGWSVDTIAEIARDGKPSIEVELDEATTEDKNKGFLDLRELVTAEEPRISLPPDPQVRADLLAVQRVLTPTGMRFPLPTTGDGRHADYAPSLTGALRKARDGVSWISAMRRMKARREAEGVPKPWEKARSIT